MRPRLVASLLVLLACGPPCDFHVRGLCVALTPDMRTWRDVPGRMDRLIQAAEDLCGHGNLSGWTLEFTRDEDMGCGVDLNPFDVDPEYRGCTDSAPWWLDGDRITIRISNAAPFSQCLEHEAIVHELCHVYGWDDGHGPLEHNRICQLWTPVADGVPECAEQLADPMRYQCWW